MTFIHTITSVLHTRPNFIPFQGRGILLRDSRQVSHEYANTNAVRACSLNNAPDQSLWEKRYRQQSVQLETTIAALEVVTATVKVLQLEIARLQQQVPLELSAGQLGRGST